MSPGVSAFGFHKVLKIDSSIFFQFQENTARDIQRELSKVTEEFTSQVHSLEEKISQLISEKVWKPRRVHA